MTVDPPNARVSQPGTQPQAPLTPHTVLNQQPPDWLNDRLPHNSGRNKSTAANSTGASGVMIGSLTFELCIEIQKTVAVA